MGHYVEATRDLEANEVVLEDDAAVLGPDHDTVPVCLECLSRYTALSMMHNGCPIGEIIYLYSYQTLQSAKAGNMEIINFQHPLYFIPCRIDGGNSLCKSLDGKFHSPSKGKYVQISLQNQEGIAKQRCEICILTYVPDFALGNRTSGVGEYVPNDIGAHF